MTEVPPRLPARPSLADLRATRGFLTAMLWESMQAILARWERDPAYGWLDTKFNLADGRDFPHDDRLRGRDTVYAWVQGRGLEALAAHLDFFTRRGMLEPGSAEAGRFRAVLAGVSAALDAARRAAGGRLYFSLDAAGRPKRLDESGGWSFFQPGPDAPSNLSDIFCSRGLFAAARALGDRARLDEARRYCLATCRDVERGRFESDQPAFDPKNPVKAEPGRRSHAPYMLLIPSYELLLRAEGRREYGRAGLACLTGIIARHVHDGRFVEFVDQAGRPWTSGGAILSDPGHALEFIGLSLQFLSGLGLLADEELAEAAGPARAGLPGLFLRMFEAGFEPRLGGIVKLLDLAGGRTVNADMPWWSLPEAMRAALECLRVDGGRRAGRLLAAYAACYNALVGNYLRVDVHMMCVQMRDGQGRLSTAIPAVPDADPGYHTGLAVMRCVDLLSD